MIVDLTRTIGTAKLSLF